MTTAEYFEKLKQQPPCQCSHCTESRAWNEIVARGDVAELRALIEELRNRLAETEEDLSYHEAILEGSWPSSYEQLERVMGKWAT